MNLHQQLQMDLNGSGPEVSPEQQLWWGEDDDADSTGSDYMSNDSDSDWIPSEI